MDEDEYILQPGTELHVYRIERTLGRGGFGITYEATHIKLHKRVAIKEYFPSEYATRDESDRVVDLNPQSGVFESEKAKFEKEAHTLARLNHPNIVQVIDYFSALGTVFLVMEYVAETTLQDLLDEIEQKRRDPLSEKQLLKVIDSLLDALSYMHEQQYIHRDIKPDNIVMLQKHDQRNSFTPMLIDLGSTRKYIDRNKTKLHKTKKPHTLIGTMGYAAIEQVLPGYKQGPWTDIYGLGATLYHVVTGEPPPDAGYLAHVKKRNPLHDALFKAARCKYSAVLLNAIDKSLAIQPHDRPQSIEEFRSYLKSKKVISGRQALMSLACSSEKFRRYLMNLAWLVVAVAFTSSIAQLYKATIGSETTVKKNGTTVEFGEVGVKEKGCTEGMFKIPAGEYGLPENTSVGHQLKWIGSESIKLPQFFYIKSEAIQRSEFMKFYDKLSIEERKLLGMYSNWRKDSKLDENQEDPVTHVSWKAADAFVEWYNAETGCTLELPSVNEWAAAVIYSEQESLDKLSRSLLEGQSEWSVDSCERGRIALGYPSDTPQQSRGKQLCYDGTYTPAWVSFRTVYHEN